MTDKNLFESRGIFPLGELTARGARDFGTHPAMRVWRGTEYNEFSFSELNKRVVTVARWLLANKIQVGDRVAVLGENRPEWGICYLAVQTAGAVIVPVDSLMPAPGIRHILNHSGARLLFISAKLLYLLYELDLPSIGQVVCFEPNSAAKISLTEILANPVKSDEEFPNPDLDETAAILYTSGTTGHSKGVMLTHRNIVSNVSAAHQVYGFGPGDTFLSVLPLHHAFECTAGFLLPIYCGASITYSRSLKSTDIIEDIKGSKVSVMVGVPLLYEKMQAGIVRGVKKKGKVTEKLFDFMYGTVSLGERVGLQLGEKVFYSLRAKAGLGSLQHIISGGGPLDPKIGSFFVRLGIYMHQGYGLTETSPVTHVNPPWMTNNATVGLPLPGVECKIDKPNTAGVGEICLKGPNVFKGYFLNDEATADVFDAEGWFHTGDLGFILPDGTLQISGRAKNMIVTSGGKNVYPEEIEFYLNRSQYIEESLVLPAVRDSGYGEEVVALIYPNYEELDSFFAHYGIKATEKDVHQLISAEIAKAQGELASYKRITKFRIVEEEFQKTSTRKIKRFLYSGKLVKVG